MFSLTLYVVLDTPPVVPIIPARSSPGTKGRRHRRLNSAKVTSPVGATDVVPTNVAVSVAVIPTPTVADVGRAWVVIPGAGFTVICSSGSLPPQLVITLLLASPLEVASQ